MGNKNKKSSSAMNDDSKIKKHKQCSTATDVDTAYASSSKSLKSGQEYEIKELSKSIKELTEAMKKQQEILNELVSFMEKETPDIAEEAMPSCAFDCKEAEGNNRLTLLVKGFENLHPSNEIKKMLTRYFSSCGEVRRVFVPFECKTRVPLGFAFINMNSGRDKALELNGRKLKVKVASECEEFSVIFV